MTETILVIGAGGFLGSNILKALEREGMRVEGSIRNAKGGNLRSMQLSDPRWLRDLLAGGEFSTVIFALGGAGSSGGKNLDPKDWDSFKKGVSAARELLSDCSRIIYLGSASEYGRDMVSFDENSPLRPVDQYGESKVIETSFMESIMWESQNLTIVRPTSVYGPGQKGRMFIPGALRAAESGQKIEVLKPKTTRDYIYVSDLANAFVKMSRDPKSLPPILNLSTGILKSLEQVGDILESKLGLKGKLFEYRKEVSDLGEQDRISLNSELAMNVLDWAPIVDIETGLSLVAKT